MQPEMPADPTPTAGHDDDVVRRAGAAPSSRPADEDDQMERERLERERAQLLQRERAARLEAEAARAQAEAALARARESEAAATARLNTILETMAEGVVVYDAADRPVQLVNRARRCPSRRRPPGARCVGRWSPGRTGTSAPGRSTGASGR